MVSVVFYPGAIVAASANVDGRLAFWAVAGAALGIYLFVRGFLMLRYKRMIQNTPASKIRSASMGLVELSGMAEGPQTIPAGITGEACFYYRAIAWQLKESGRSNEWKKVADESLYVPFFINDTTGRMLVDAAGADMEVTKNFHDEFSSSFFGSRDMLPENVSGFLARNGVLGGEKVKLEERCVKPGYPLFVFGTLAPHSIKAPGAGEAEWGAKPHMASSSMLDMNVSLQGLRRSGSLSAARAVLLNRNMPLSAPVAKPVPAQAMWSSVSIDEVEMAHGRANARAARTAVAEAPAEPAGPMAPAPQEEPATLVGAFDQPQPAVLCKGADRAPFMISSESQREVVRALGWKSALCIWGGPILALAGVYYLLAYLGLT